MDGHVGSAPTIPVWKVLADGQKRVSLNTYARRNGIPCWNRTSLCDFAGRRLICSANETFKCRLKNAKCRMPGGSFRLRRHCCLLLASLNQSYLRILRVRALSRR